MSEPSSLVPLRYYVLSVVGVAGLAPSVIWGVVGGAPTVAAGAAFPFAALLGWSGYRLVQG